MSPQTQTYLFVGERRSQRAQQLGVTWTDGHLAAKTLHDALRAVGLDPAAHEYTNVFTDAGELDLREIDRIERWGLTDYTVVAMGQRAQDTLKKFAIPFVALIHPAARGRIRGKATYQAHVATVLCQEVAS